MRTLTSCLTVLYGLMLWYEVRVGLTEYAAFKLLTDTIDRQRVYRRWLLRSFFCFPLSALAGLIVLGRMRALIGMPREFFGFAQEIHSRLPVIPVSRELVLVLCVSVCVGVLLGGVVAAKMAGKGRSFMMGDVQPLMPRNWTETGHTALLSLNAGLGEELLFRLVLPLLLTLITGHAIVGFSVAAVVFGVMHVYQGILGVVATTLIGMVLTGIYLATGSIWMVVAVHIGIDLLGLVVRPTIVRLIQARWQRQQKSGSIR